MGEIRAVKVTATNTIQFQVKDNAATQVYCGLAEERMGAKFLCHDEKDNAYYFANGIGLLVIIGIAPKPKPIQTK